MKRFQLFNLTPWVVFLAAMFLITGCKILPKQDPSFTFEPPPVEQPGTLEIEVPTPEKKGKGLLGKIFRRSDKTKPEEAPRQPVISPSTPSDTDSGPVVQKLPAGLNETIKRTTLEIKLQVGDPVGITLGEPIGWSSSDKIDVQGNINLPIIGAFPATGKTISELEKGISDVYVERQIVRNYLHVTVTTAVKSYYIQGEVRQPGRYPLTPPMTLSKAIAAAGGCGPWANKKDVRIARERDVYEVDYSKIDRDIRLDIEILANDLITVPKDKGPLGLGRE